MAIRQKSETRPRNACVHACVDVCKRSSRKSACVLTGVRSAVSIEFSTHTEPHLLRDTQAIANTCDHNGENTHRTATGTQKPRDPITCTPYKAISSQAPSLALRLRTFMLSKLSCRCPGPRTKERHRETLAHVAITTHVEILERLHLLHVSRTQHMRRRDMRALRGTRGKGFIDRETSDRPKRARH
jgi:hypothetical protein